MKPMHSQRQQAGIALIMVLGLVIFLTLIALPFSESQRVSTQVASNTLGSATSQAAADGAANRMVYELSRARSADAQIALQQWKADGLVHSWVENGTTMAVSAKSETAKIDLNFGAEAVLKRVFTFGGATDEEADAVVSAVKDWTDADNLKRPNGAEADDYKTAGKKVLPSNDFFVAIEELQNVMGMTPKLYNAVAPLLTVHGRSPGVDPQSASAQILGLIPGIDATQAQTWVEQRDQALREGVPPPPIPFSSPYFAGGQNAVRIRADAVTASGIKSSREASLRLGGVARGRPQFFLWQKGLTADSLPMPSLSPTPVVSVNGASNG